MEDAEQCVHLAPPGLLLEAVTDADGRLADGQELAHVAALPVALFELHAQRKVLCQRPGGRPAALLEGVGADQEVGACGRAGQSRSDNAHNVSRAETACNALLQPLECTESSASIALPGKLSRRQVLADNLPLNKQSKRTRQLWG